jgi:uncharacterized OB-fold protein
MSVEPKSPRPTPESDRQLAPFLAAAKEHRLVVQRCTGCGQHRFPPRELCSGCLAAESTWVALSGHGEIFSYNVMHQIYHPAFATEVPYAVVVVKLVEGPKMISNLVDCPLSEIRIGMPVDVVFEAITDTVTLPKFRRV